MDLFIDGRFASEFERAPLVLADVGARGGLKSNWARAARHLRVIGFEPEKQEFDRLARADDPARRYFNTALHNRRGTVQLHVARDGGLSSIFPPNREFLDAFPDAARFDIVKHAEVMADTLDAVLAGGGIDDVDFIKADTQGSELFVLEGARGALTSTVTGVEVEVEFAPIYTGQPLFADVDAYLRGLGFQLLDLRPVYWKRATGRHAGGPRGQIVWADALYLKTAPALMTALANIAPERRKGKLLRAISVALLYGYQDYALHLAQHARALLSTEELAVIQQRLTEEPSSGVPLPGRRFLSAVLHRLWKATQPRDRDAWSISGADLGNPR